MMCPHCVRTVILVLNGSRQRGSEVAFSVIVAMERDDVSFFSDEYARAFQSRL
jgi:hypothetical protein